MTRAIVATAYGGPEVLSLIDVEVPAPPKGKVTIDVKAAAVNQFDYKSYSGALGSDPTKLPKRLGMEVSGIVASSGTDAEGPAGAVSVGDEVIAYPVKGGYAAQVTVSASAVLPKPQGTSWEQAAGLLLTGLAAYHLLEATGVQTGDTVLIHGASGGVGLIASQLAVERGATVVGTAAPRRHERLVAFGVTPVAYGDGLTDRVHTAAPCGVQAALDTVGTDEAVDVSLALVADRQRIATIAAFGRASEVGIQLLGNGPGADPGKEIRSRGRMVLAHLAAQRKLSVVVAETFPLERAADAHRLVADGHAGGKVVLIP
ncbi:MAG: Quinone oxidoreductase [uncultured Nocardioidaceae bacterium]|uniref:Quinone oxidoreductase n=1 Tax=uncultured Nocardioidaceae bacterium TaxID=253824 RepID=A0A6J4N0Q5_9ACTN|nr:MAG: Quinone oxidoreductase [uncultured Nocardioidaceae bacterium]